MKNDLFAVPGEVTSITVHTIPSSPDSLQVSWIPPPQSCPVDSYAVHYQLTNRDQCNDTTGAKTKFGDTTDTTITVTGLYAYSSYDVFVTSINIDGSAETNGSGMTDVASKCTHGSFKLF